MAARQKNACRSELKNLYLTFSTMKQNFCYVPLAIEQSEKPSCSISDFSITPGISLNTGLALREIFIYQIFLRSLAKQRFGLDYENSNFQVEAVLCYPHPHANKKPRNPAASNPLFREGTYI